MKYRTTMLLLFLAVPALASAATLEWASWGNVVSNSRTGSFSDGRTVQLTGTLEGFGAPPAGTEYTASPAIPGTAGNGNPSFVRLSTGPIGTTLNANDVIATIDLGTLMIDDSTVFGLGDQRTGRQYRLELRDGSQNLLSLADIIVTPYNLSYTSDGLIADLNSTLFGDLLLVDGVHDAGGLYLHTGLTTLSNLPAATRSIRLVSNVFQDAEGIQLYLGTTVVPAPGGLWLLGTAVAALGLRRRGLRSTLLRH